MSGRTVRDVKITLEELCSGSLKALAPDTPGAPSLRIAPGEPTPSQCLRGDGYIIRPAGSAVGTDHYSVLSQPGKGKDGQPGKSIAVSRTSNLETIKKAKNKLMLLYHPDKCAADPALAEKAAQINVAFETLSDPERKREYDNPNALVHGAAAAPREWKAYIVLEPHAERKRRMGDRAAGPELHRVSWDQCVKDGMSPVEATDMMTKLCSAGLLDGGDEVKEVARAHREGSDLLLIKHISYTQAFCGLDEGDAQVQLPGGRRATLRKADGRQLVKSGETELFEGAGLPKYRGREGEVGRLVVEYQVDPPELRRGVLDEQLMPALSCKVEKIKQEIVASNEVADSDKEHLHRQILAVKLAMATLESENATLNEEKQTRERSLWTRMRGSSSKPTMDDDSDQQLRGYKQQLERISADNCRLEQEKGVMEDELQQLRPLRAQLDEQARRHRKVLADKDRLLKTALTDRANDAKWGEQLYHLGEEQGIWSQHIMDIVQSEGLCEATGSVDVRSVRDGLLDEIKAAFDGMHEKKKQTKDGIHAAAAELVQNVSQMRNEEGVPPRQTTWTADRNTALGHLKHAADATIDELERREKERQALEGRLEDAHSTIAQHKADLQQVAVDNESLQQRNQDVMASLSRQTRSLLEPSGHSQQEVLQDRPMRALMDLQAQMQTALTGRNALLAVLGYPMSDGVRRQLPTQTSSRHMGSAVSGVPTHDALLARTTSMSSGTAQSRLGEIDSAVDEQRHETQQLHDMQQARHQSQHTSSSLPRQSPQRRTALVSDHHQAAVNPEVATLAAARLGRPVPASDGGCADVAAEAEPEPEPEWHTVAGECYSPMPVTAAPTLAAPQQAADDGYDMFAGVPLGGPPAAPRACGEEPAAASGA